MPPPAIFFGHGSPMNCLGGAYADEWTSFGKTIEKPRAILMISAHWETDGAAVTAMDAPRTIHDFSGFPAPLYDIRYPARGDRALAQRVAELLAPDRVAMDQDWGLDHGAWGPLMFVFPDADAPVVQLSLDVRLSGAQHYARAQKLAPLRDEGVMIVGSGDIVHNLRLMSRTGEAAPLDWAQRFHDDVKARVTAGDHAALVAYEQLGADAGLSIPTPEHYLPLLYVLAQQRAGERAAFFTDGIDLGSVSMLGVKIS